jgi:hypothetical protein
MVINKQSVTEVVALAGDGAAFQRHTVRAANAGSSYTVQHFPPSADDNPYPSKDCITAKISYRKCRTRKRVHLSS